MAEASTSEWLRILDEFSAFLFGLRLQVETEELQRLSRLKAYLSSKRHWLSWISFRKCSHTAGSNAGPGSKPNAGSEQSRRAHKQ